MTDDGYPRLERRSSVRIAPKGSVVMTGAGWVRHGRVTNMSTGGMLVAAAGSGGALAERVAIDVRLDGAHGEWVRVSGDIARIEGEAVGITFVDPPALLGELVSGISSDAQMRDRRMSLVLVDATTVRRQHLAEAFRAAGCLVIDVETPLDAITALGGADFEPDLIAIADSGNDGIADDLRAFVRAAHPAVKLVRIGDDITGPAGHAHWLSTSNPEDDLVARIRRLLGSHS